MLWPHTKTPVPAEAGYKLLFGMLEFFACEVQSFHHNSVPHISTPPLFGKLYKLLLYEDKNPQMPGYADTNFTNIIYTKLAGLLSIKKFQSIHTFLRKSTIEMPLCDESIKQAHRFTVSGAATINCNSFTVKLIR
jgi:hypothetical protein